MYNPMKAILTFAKIPSNKRESAQQEKLILTSEKPIHFGRNPACEIHFKDVTLSSKHIIFTLDEKFGHIHANVVGRNGAWLVRDGKEKHVKAETVESFNGDSWYLRTADGEDIRIHVSAAQSHGSGGQTQLVEDIITCEEEIQELDRENTVLYSKLLVRSKDHLKLDDNTALVPVAKSLLDDQMDVLYVRIAHLEKELIERKVELEMEFAKLELEKAKQTGEVLEANKRMRAVTDEIAFKKRKLVESVNPHEALRDADDPMHDREKHLPYEDMLKMEEELALKALDDEQGVALALESGVESDAAPSLAIADIERVDADV